MTGSSRRRSARVAASAADREADEEQEGPFEDEQPAFELTGCAQKGRRQTAQQLAALKKLQAFRKSREQKSSETQRTRKQEAAGALNVINDQSGRRLRQPLHTTSSSSDKTDHDDPQPASESAKERADELASPSAAAKARHKAKSAVSSHAHTRARQLRSKFVHGGVDRASSPDSDGDLDDFLASDSEEEETRLSKTALRKHQRLRRKVPRSTRDKLNWSESSASDSQTAAKTTSNTKRKQPDVDLAASSGGYDEEPLPAKRGRPLAYILDGEEGWDAASLPEQAPLHHEPAPGISKDPSSSVVPANKRRCVELAASDDADEPGPSSHLLDVDRLQAADAALLHSNKPGTDLGTPLARAGLTNKPQQPSPTSHAGMLPDSSQAQEPNPEHHALQNSVQPAVEQVHKQDDDVTANADSSDSEDMLQVRRSTRRRVHNARADNHVESDELQEMFMPLETATQLEEEGLDPLPEQATEQRASRRTSSGRPSRMDIRARMQQNQQKLRQGGKRPRRSTAEPLLANTMQQIWHGSSFRPPTDSDSEYSSSEATSASAASASHQGSGTSGADSDLGDFIVDDAGGDTNNAHDTSNDDDFGDEHAAFTARAAADQPESILQQAGFIMKQSDGDYFRIYIQYLVYDLVDKTFVVRLHQDKSLYRYYDDAVKHVEETMANRRDMCVVSSAWMQAVPGLMDHLDTLPGLSSDWTDADSHETQDGVCQACQKGQTAGHAVKALVLKGKPYKPLWKYGYRRVSNAHIRSQQPYNNEDRSSDDDQQEPDDDREEHKYSVGRFCCARLQMYHALMHYKHRLRGKLKKRVKKEFSLQRLRHEKQDWVKAADNYLAKSEQIRSLYQNYKSLVDVATSFNTQAGSSWRRAMDNLQGQVDTLLYQLNSDSEGDEGSEIGAHEEEEEEEEVSGQRQAEGNDSDEPLVRQPRTSKLPPSSPGQETQKERRSSITVGQQSPNQNDLQHHAQPSDRGFERHGSNLVSTANPGARSQVDESLPNASAGPSASALQQHQSDTTKAHDQPDTTTANDACMSDSSHADQFKAAMFSQQCSLATLPYTAEAATLPYAAATDSSQAVFEAASNSQQVPGGATDQPAEQSYDAGRTVASPKAGTLIDLTEDQATSKSELLQQAPLTSSVRGTVQEDVAGTPRPLPSHGMTTPVKKGSTMPTDRSPSTSGTKHKQVDIRQFFKSP